MAEIARHRTAIGRTEWSRPVRLAVELQLIEPGCSVLDYGCGRGSDVAFLQAAGVNAIGWDPVHRPETLLVPADVVNLGYVINVIEDPVERGEAIRRAFALARQVLIVAARLDIDKSAAADVEWGDGRLTRRNTFQKYFTQLELKQWIEAMLGACALAASPGVYFVFRDEEMAERFLRRRQRRAPAAIKVRKSDALFESHRLILEPLMQFVVDHGRVPEPDEFRGDELIQAFGTVKRAFALVKRVTGNEQWEDVENARRDELLVRLALERFSKRPRFTELPTTLRRDIKALLSSYTRAVEEADRLLFSVGQKASLEEQMRRSKVGKLTGNALYVHAEALRHLPPTLQVYEGCARAFAGVVDAANVIKLHRSQPQVSYLLYPEIESTAHPALQASLVVHLQRCELSYREYPPDGNPPVLHRKEELVAADHPMRSAWAALTASEQSVGLYDDVATIGTRDGWESALRVRGLIIAGHTLRPAETVDPGSPEEGRDSLL